MPVRGEPARQRQQLWAIALHDRGECAILPSPRQADEPLVGLRAEKQVRQPGTHVCVNAGPRQATIGEAVRVAPCELSAARHR